MSAPRFEPCTLPPAAEALRTEVRAFLAEALADFPAEKRAESWSGGDRAFSRKVGARGWIGMTWPKRYGGHERSFLERYVVLEEMLAAGAPVMYHWIADRQSGPLILRYGTEAQRQAIIPGICRGELAFCIGMSEPDSGSDLASIRTRATRVPGGWRVNGTKIWTSKAHEADYMIALVRTGGGPEDKHAGLSQLLVDMKNTTGVTPRPIRNLAGERQFNEVHFEDAFVSEDMLLGEEGGGWAQVTAELAFERSGPERYLSSFPLIAETVRALPQPGERAAEGIGRMVARLAVLRQMSLAVAGRLDAGETPGLEAAFVKELGVGFEQAVPQMVHDMIGAEPLLDRGSGLEKVLAYVTMVAPSFSLRGGTREIIRGIVARGLGLR